MKLITYCLYALGIIGVINALIKFAENTHKYGPFVAKAVIEKTTTFGHAFSFKNTLGLAFASVFLASVLSVSTETVLAPSNHSANIQVAANIEDLRRIRAELMKENQELKELRRIAPEYHRKPQPAVVFILGNVSR